MFWGKVFTDSDLKVAYIIGSEQHKAVNIMYPLYLLQRVSFGLCCHHQVVVVQIHKKEKNLWKGLPLTDTKCDLFLYSKYWNSYKKG